MDDFEKEYDTLDLGLDNIPWPIDYIRWNTVNHFFAEVSTIIKETLLSNTQEELEEKFGPEINKNVYFSTLREKYYTYIGGLGKIFHLCLSGCTDVADRFRIFHEIIKNDFFPDITMFSEFKPQDIDVKHERIGDRELQCKLALWTMLYITPKITCSMKKKKNTAGKGDNQYTVCRPHENYYVSMCGHPIIKQEPNIPTGYVFNCARKCFDCGLKIICPWCEKNKIYTSTLGTYYIQKHMDHKLGYTSPIYVAVKGSDCLENEQRLIQHRK